MSWSRRTIGERVDALAAEHEGRAFAEAVERFAAELGEDDRALLGEVLLERASAQGDLAYGLVRRIDEPRWNLFGRLPDWKRLGRPPDEPGRGSRPRKP